MRWAAFALLSTLAVPVSASDHTAITRDELRDMPPALIAERLLGDQGRRVTHRRLCALVEGSGCNGFAAGTIILSEDFGATGFAGLCAARQWTTSDRTPEHAVTITLAPLRQSTAFRVGTPCRGRASRYTHPGEFTLFKAGAPATAADAWKVLQTARQGRTALSLHVLPVDRRRDPIFPTGLCDDPSAALAEAKLANIYRVGIDEQPAGGSVLRLELWGRDPKRDSATYLWVNLDLALDFDALGPATIRRVTIEENTFVD